MPVSSSGLILRDVVADVPNVCLSLFLTRHYDYMYKTIISVSEQVNYVTFCMYRLQVCAAEVAFCLFLREPALL